MATRGQDKVGYSLVNIGTLTLEDPDSHPDYNGIVVSRDRIIVIDYKPWNDRYVYKVRLHRLQDGKLLATSHRLQSAPRDICLMNEMEICVLLWNGIVEIMSIESTDMTDAITKIRTLDVQRVFDRYDAVVRFKENIVLCGVKKDTMSWCIVSLDDGHVDTIHQTCKDGVLVDKVWSESSVTTNNNMIYISCYAGSNSPDTGVYGYDVLNPSPYKYIYKHKDLYWPNGITINKVGFVFVSNFLHPFCIHQLTDKCHLVSIFTHGIPRNLWAIFWDQGQGHIFVTCSGSNHVTIFRSEHQGDQKAFEVPISNEKYQPIYERTSIDIGQGIVDKGLSSVETEIPQYVDVKKEDGPSIPLEILRMDNESVQLYRKALLDGKETIYNIRVMVVGQYGVGKTTLTKRLLGQTVDISERKSTEGIDIHKHCCKISLDTGEWIVQLEDSDQLSRLQRLMKLLSGSDQKPDVVQKGEGNIEFIYQRETSYEIDANNNNVASARRESCEDVCLPYSQPAESPFYKADNIHITQRSDQKSRTNVPLPPHDAKVNEKIRKDAVMEILQLINENASKLETDTAKYASLSIWDFAGQYIFYTTHHTFLTSRALYILVIDLNQQVTDHIQDDTCFFDVEGIKRCKVHDLVEVWLNSVHTCLPSPESSIPHVILVGTHVDKLPEKCRNEIIDKYFKKLRYILKDKPIICHLMDDVAIDNTKIDPMLEELKRRLFELATEQPHWGEKKPARWLPLEQAIMTLKASGTKVVTLDLIEEINRSGSVMIEDRNELDLFLRFHHEMGTILYFSVDGLREKIVLDPQWLIDALKSLITAEKFIRKYPSITSKWFEFEEEGKLTQELIDAIWTEKNHKEFHDNKDHILLLMEKLNIIARPRSLNQDGEVKEDDYFLAPCMLRQETPQDVICPKPNPQMESSSVLCYVFTEKFLPSPIFHRLLAACAARWPLATKKKEEMQEIQIFCGCCVFQLDKCHKLILYFREYVIFMRVTRMGIKEKTPSSDLCIGAREFITAVLSKIIGYLSQNLKYEQHIQCPEYSGVSVNSLIPVSLLVENREVRCDFHDNIIESYNLLKYWFADQVQSGEYIVYHLLSDQGLLHVASRLGVEWKFVALNLDLTQAEIDRIQMDMPGKTLDQIHNALSTWLNRSVKNDHDNILQLLNAIEDVKRNDLVLELKEKFHV